MDGAHHAKEDNKTDVADKSFLRGLRDVRDSQRNRLHFLIESRTVRILLMNDINISAFLANAQELSPGETAGAIAALAALLAAMIIPILIVSAIYVVAMWKIFAKAGQPGWAAIVPIYNTVVMLQISGRPVWWIIMFFIPFVNLVFAILLCVSLAKAFGKDGGFAVGLILLAPIFLPILAFGGAQYQGPAVASVPPAPAAPPADPPAAPPAEGA